MVRQNFQRNRKAKRVHSRGMEESENKSDVQEWRCGKCWKLPRDLLMASVVQTFHDNTVQQIISTTRPVKSGRSGGIQKLIQTTDHLSTYRMIEQKCHECGIKMWTATTDFTKAFDSITHNSIWTALKSFGIEHDYISLLKKIYRDQKASVQTDEESNMFEIKKGTKQCDPLSSLLFNMLLQKALEDDIPRWQKKKEWEFT